MCALIDGCQKIQLILDKGFDVQDLYPAFIQQACDNCKEQTSKYHGYSRSADKISPSVLVPTGISGY